MRFGVWRFSLMACLILLASGVLHAQSAPKDANGTKVNQLKGLPGVKDKTSGRLLVDGGTLRFTHEVTKVELPVSSVEDVITGADSQRLVHGTLGTLTMFAPYGGGRFLSLFRTKLDSLTIKYRDNDGGLHGAIFSMGAGKAEPLKKDLLAHGARSSVPDSDDASTVGDKKEQKQ
jgi:hypothetical protein